jgi:N-acetylglucosamine-6-phosphate deacetylase
MTAPAKQVRQADPVTLLRGRVVLLDRVVADGAVAIGGQYIVAAGERRAVESELDARGLSAENVPLPSGTTLLPGLIDVHCHGGGGNEFGADHARARDAALYHHRQGTTTVVASVVSSAADEMAAAAEVGARLAAEGLVAGVHLEGPFLSPRRCGAQDPQALRPADPAALQPLLESMAGHGVAVTLAPEHEAAIEVIDLLVAADVLPAFGHTDADAATTAAAIEHARSRLGGQRPLVTHLFNGMPPLHHRRPGAAGAALAAAAQGDAVVELIADGVHLDPETVRLVLACAAPGCAVLVSDSTAATGMPPGRFRLGHREVVVRQGAAVLADGTSLAGSTSTLLDVVRRTWAAGTALERAVAAASAHPARVLGLEDVGNLAAGRRADVVAVDAALRLRAVWRAGFRLESSTRQGEVSA